MFTYLLFSALSNDTVVTSVLAIISHLGRTPKLVCNIKGKAQGHAKGSTQTYKTSTICYDSLKNYDLFKVVIKCLTSCL